MYDMSKEFNTFYEDYVKLSENEQNRLRDFRHINIERLESGLDEYNEDNNTNIKLAKHLEQGSVAMGTVTQYDAKEYDIDVAIIFDKDKFPEGTTATKNIIADAMKRKTSQFNTEPQKKTNCIRIVYDEGYHIDFAIYRRDTNIFDEYVYEHCGSKWRERDPRAINDWFIDSNKSSSDDNLRKVVRLMKMFSKSRDSWNMPGGLIQSILVEECLSEYNRLDKTFYYTMTAIKDRLLLNKEVKNPVSYESIIYTEKDKNRIENLYNRLDKYLDKLEILFDEDCAEEDAVDAWDDFFNNMYWSNLISEGIEKSAATLSYNFNDTEEFIEEKYLLNNKYNLEIDCKVTKPWNEIDLSQMLRLNIPVEIGDELLFYIKTNEVPSPYQVFWKVRNRGKEAKRLNKIRGRITRDDGKEQKYEEAKFVGPHYVECFIIKNDICVASDRINVPISN